MAKRKADMTPEELEKKEIYRKHLNELCYARYGCNAYHTFTSDGHTGLITLQKGTMYNLQCGEFPKRKSTREKIVHYFNDELYIDDFSEKPVKKTNRKIGIKTYWDFIAYLKYGSKHKRPCSPAFSARVLRDRLKEQPLRNMNILFKQFAIDEKTWQDALDNNNSFIFAYASELEEFFDLPKGKLTQKDDGAVIVFEPTNFFGYTCETVYSKRQEQKRVNNFLKHYLILDFVFIKYHNDIIYLFDSEDIDIFMKAALHSVTEEVFQEVAKEQRMYFLDYYKWLGKKWGLTPDIEKMKYVYKDEIINQTQDKHEDEEHYRMLIYPFE